MNTLATSAIGAAAFALFVLFDFNKAFWHKKNGGLYFLAGLLMLALDTVYTIVSCGVAVFAPEHLIRGFICIIIIIASFAALIYTLFFSLPVGDTYVTPGKVKLVDTGLYSICRHPGFWWFLIMYAAVYFMAPCKQTAAMAIAFPLYNLLYILVQDVCIFPKYIIGYTEYKTVTRFIIPSVSAVRRLITRR